MVMKKISIVGLITIALAVSFNAGFLFNGYLNQGQQVSAGTFLKAVKSSIQVPGDACAVDYTYMISSSCAKKILDECQSLCDSHFDGNSKSKCQEGCVYYAGKVNYPI